MNKIKPEDINVETLTAVQITAKKLRGPYKPRKTENLANE